MRNNCAKFIVIAISLLVFLSFGTVVSAQEKMTKAELQELYVNYLTKEGYKPSIDSDGDVVFKKEGRTYFIAVRENDLEYFTIVLPNFWEIESERERLQVLISADAANAKSKVAKVFTIRDNTWAAIELFVSGPEDFEGIFTRSLRAIDNAVNNFVDKMKELREDKTPSEDAGEAEEAESAEE